MSSDAEFDEANALSTAEKTAAPSTPTKRKRWRVVPEWQLEKSKSTF
ncbi:hypothetical protein PF001_g31835, partial [Phytophthora fragariae]